LFIATTAESRFVLHYTYPSVQLAYIAAASLMADGLVPHHISHGSSASNERPRLAAVVRVRANEVVGETGLERNDRLEVLDVFARELDVEGLDVVLEVLDFAAGGSRCVSDVLVATAGDEDSATYPPTIGKTYGAFAIT
jgi:hypothetical protein